MEAIVVFFQENVIDKLNANFKSLGEFLAGLWEQLSALFESVDWAGFFTGLGGE